MIAIKDSTGKVHLHFEPAQAPKETPFSMGVYAMPGIDRKGHRVADLKERIKIAVAHEMDLDPVTLDIRTRINSTERIMDGKHLHRYFYWLFFHQEKSLKGIAREFDIGHATLIWTLRNIRNWYETDPAMQRHIDHVAKMLKTELTFYKYKQIER